MAAAVKSPSFFPPSMDKSGLPSAPFSPLSNAEATSPTKSSSNKRSSTDSAGRLLPQPPKPSDASSPTSAGPSPIAPSSNGTDIDDTAEEEEHVQAADSAGTSTPPSTNRSSVTVVTRDEDGNTLRNDSPEANPASVIHAPKDYLSFPQGAATGVGRQTPTPATRSEVPQNKDPLISGEPVRRDSITDSPLSPPPIDTAVRPAHDPYATPRATTRTDIEAERKERGRKPSLENIPEDSTVEETDDERPQSAFFESEADRQRRSGEEVAALHDALSECWTLCNTLAGLSSRHRERAFRHAKGEDKREQAWKCCWKLCQKLYETRDDAAVAEAGPTLDLCREFCQSLFEVRQKGDEVADSVLRVSFEMNNHLYNTHDRSLPDEFRERTLDFYITLCHRLMKQRNAMVEEADSLLRACWGLAEMLFSLRQNRREGKKHNEELLGSAVQACWELCDLFREGWKQVRPDRGTPRPSSFGFSRYSSSSSRQYERPKSVNTISIGESSDEDLDEGRLNPETPTTIFEDTNQLSPDEASVPNILVLGPEANEYPLPPWSSNTSDVGSHYSSADSHRTGRSRNSSSKITDQPGAKPGLGVTSSSSTTMSHHQDAGLNNNAPSQADAARLACLKLLIVRAAQIVGFDRAKNPGALQNFVKSSPSNSFGTAPWQQRLLEDYKKLVAADPAFRSAGPATRASATDLGRAVRWMVHSGQYVWLDDLYRWVLGFRIDEARERTNVWVQT